MRSFTVARKAATTTFSVDMDDGCTFDVGNSIDIGIDSDIDIDSRDSVGFVGAKKKEWSLGL